MSNKQSQADNQPPAGKEAGHGGKVENDTYQTGDQEPTQKNEGRRTPQSRNDRESWIGSANQTQSRRGNSGGSSGGR
jgi:hypothetical protein